ncbi:hypothetical protein V5799_019861 [Amblyomma americanum]|uniref:Presenilin n=1 Tax=Amblyomma americanum TaxID=6943 RepID=A0AAQ4EW47_AMBAM
MGKEERPRRPAKVTLKSLEDIMRHLFQLLTAISCCMMLVVVTVNANPQRLLIGDHSPFGSPLPDTNEQETFTRAINAVANAVFLLAQIIVPTVVMVTMYYYRFYRIMRAWITFVSCWILVEAPAMYMKIVCGAYGVQMDIFSAGLLVYNFMALGLAVSVSKEPLALRQFYWIVESSFMALILIRFLPSWTLWAVLCLIPIWDLVAVLATIGPLRIMVEAAAERKDGLHADGFVFSTAADGIEMGLGDFVFYSVLAGKVAMLGDWAIVFASFVGVLVGVCVTIYLAALRQSAVPALPVSLAFGLTFAAFQNIIHSFNNELLAMQAFI